MNVLLACPWPLHYRGGVTVIAQMLARGLVRAGDRVCFLLPTHGTRIERKVEAGMTVYEVPMRLPVIKRHPLRSRVAFLLCLPLTCVRLARIVHREQIDVVNVHYFSNHWIYLFLLWRLLRFRLVVSVHGTDIQGPDGSENVKALEEWLPAIDAVVFCSETARQGIRPASTLFKKTVVILNAIDLSSLPAPLGDTERSPYLICSGHLQRHKGQDILIRAFCILAAEFPEICLEIVGDGPTRPELEALVGELRLQSRVHFHGGLPREKSIEVMKSATLTCVPSRRETFGLVLLESMALGVSIVASRVGGIPEVVREQVDAILVTPENVQELATALTHVLRQRELRLFLIANAKARVGEMFTAERLVTNYRELFQRVMSEKGAGAGI